MPLTAHVLCPHCNEAEQHVVEMEDLYPGKVPFLVQCEFCSTHYILEVKSSFEFSLGIIEPAPERRSELSQLI